MTTIRRFSLGIVYSLVLFVSFAFLSVSTLVLICFRDVTSQKEKRKPADVDSIMLASLYQ